jgi:hypothetical protein
MVRGLAAAGAPDYSEERDGRLFPQLAASFNFHRAGLASPTIWTPGTGSLNFESGQRS